MTKCKTLCGDGIKKGTEECDDENTSSRDGCSSTCKLEPGYLWDDSAKTVISNCGDGFITLQEECEIAFLDTESA